MFQLTNEERRYFGLVPIDPKWRRITLKPSAYDLYDTYAWVDESHVIHKVLLISEDKYHEIGFCEQLSEDELFLLPKTEKGKPLKLSSANMLNRTAIGMSLSFGSGKNGMPEHLYIGNNTNSRCLYKSFFDVQKVDSIGALRSWIKRWCAETTETDLDYLHEIMTAPRRRVKVKEGDFFRFSFNRRQYGYGRILLNFPKKRKHNDEMWDVFGGTALAIAYYRIITDNPNLMPEELENQPMLPSHYAMDNQFSCGECPIIGNKPLNVSQMDYPLTYGRSISAFDKQPVTLLQWGNIYRRKEGIAPIASGMNNGVSLSVGIKQEIVQACIDAGNNAPYWLHPHMSRCNDLRNPACIEELKAVCRQMDIEFPEG